VIRPSPGKSIDRATRRSLKDALLTREYFWRGAKSESAFLSDLYPLNELPSTDPRYRTAYEDIQKHREMNSDWADSWVFDDPRFDLMGSSDETFLEFVAHTVHPSVRPRALQRSTMLMQLNTVLAASGYELYETTSAIGSVTFSHRRTSMASDIVPLDGPKSQGPIHRQNIGSGSYALVFSYVDPFYGIPFAIKQAKNNLDDRERQRFKQEFDSLKDLNSPYVVKVYRYDEGRIEYVMEYCDQTLEDFIKYRTGKLTFDARKRIALQFLQGMHHIHEKGLLHRDLSRRNVLVKLYDEDEVLVKISDLGLVKVPESDFTHSGTEMKGTHRDPQLEHFGDFGLRNEMHGIGYILQYIFTGRTSLTLGPGEMGRIVQKCTASDLSQRYEQVVDVITDVEAMEGADAVTA
jgi:hypothetical protein